MNSHFIKSSGIVFLAAVVFLASCSGDKTQKELRKEKPVSVHVGIPTQQSGEKIIASGQIESQETAVISTRVMGFISSVKVKPGDKVKKGQLLVVISSGDIQAKRAQAQAMIYEAEAGLKDAQKDYQRFEELYKQQSASAKEFENATLRFQSLKAKAEVAHQMKNEADEMLAYTILAAPFTGVITQKMLDEGNMANPGMPILIMQRRDVYHVSAAVAENEIGFLQNGMYADVTVKSAGKSFKAKISEISPSSQFSGGQYQIKLVIPPTENAGLFAGMYVNVTFHATNDSRIQSLSVPASSIVRKDQLAGLYTVSENQTAQLRWLKVGKKIGDQVEILSGLLPGEKFITQSESRLYSGLPVSVK
jgi:RND family efflux transporter MFP subunit